MADWDFIFSNKSYKGQIKIRAYLMNSEQICSDILKDNTENIEQKTYQELEQDAIYLVVQLKNTGGVGAWGMLKTEIYGRGPNVFIPVLTPNMDNWNNYIISLAGLAWPRKGGMPNITIEWDKLYTK